MIFPRHIPMISPSHRIGSSDHGLVVVRAATWQDGDNSGAPSRVGCRRFAKNEELQELSEIAIEPSTKLEFKCFNHLTVGLNMKNIGIEPSNMWI